MRSHSNTVDSRIRLGKDSTSSAYRSPLVSLVHFLHVLMHSQEHSPLRPSRGSLLGDILRNPHLKICHAALFVPRTTWVWTCVRIAWSCCSDAPFFPFRTRGSHNVASLVPDVIPPRATSPLFALCRSARCKNSRSREWHFVRCRYTSLSSLDGETFARYLAHEPPNWHAAYFYLPAF